MNGAPRIGADPDLLAGSVSRRDRDDRQERLGKRRADRGEHRADRSFRQTEPLADPFDAVREQLGAGKGSPTARRPARPSPCGWVMLPGPARVATSDDDPAAAARSGPRLRPASRSAPPCLSAVPALWLRWTDPHLSHAVEALLFGLAIVGAAFLLSWAAEVAQLDIAAGLALAVLALIAVLPEYAVDFVFAWKGGAVGRAVRRRVPERRARPRPRRARSRSRT